MMIVLRAMRLTRAFAAVLLGVTMVATASTADAMLIKDFDRMSAQDQANYVTMLLDRSVAYLKAEKQDAMAKKVINHFNARGSKGMAEFLDVLEDGRIIARVNGKPYEVEHAMLLTLRRIGVDVPKGVMMEFGKDFQETAPRKTPAPTQR